MNKVIDLNKRENQLSGLIIDKAIYVHKKLGPGLLETAYEQALVYFLEQENLKVEQQKVVPVQIDDLKIQTGFRADLVIEDCIICEIKAVEKLIPIHEAQLMTYLRLSGIKLGLLMNFNVPLLKQGLKRIVM